MAATSSSSSTQADPILTLPAAEQIGPYATIAVTGANYSDSFAESNAGSMYLSISDGSGLLFGSYPAADGGAVIAPGSGTDAIAFQGSYADIDAIINSLTYAATTAAGGDDIHFDLWDQAGLQTVGDVPVSIAGHAAAAGRALIEPASETVAAGATQAVSGSYQDSFAAGNPGTMFLGISDSTGTLSATDAAGNLVAGSGSNSIVLSATYAEANAVLANLTYTAAAGSGSDTIQFDIWNQAGVQSTDAVPVTIAAAAPTSETWTGAASSAWNAAANWSGDTVPVSGDAVIIPGGTPNDATLSNATLSGETITLQSNGNVLPVVDFNNVVLDSLLQSNGDGEVEIGGTLTIGAQGTIAAGAGDILSLNGTAETIVNDGLISGSAGGNVQAINGPSTGTAVATLINLGSIAADGGAVGLFAAAGFPGAPPEWSLVNSGSIVIASDGELSLNGTVTGGDIAFSGSGAMSLQQGMALADGAAVSGFGQGDQIDLLDSAAGKGGTLGFANGTLDLLQTGTLVQALPLTGSYGLGNFASEQIAGTGNPTEVAYAAGGQPSGVVQPDVVAPAAAFVAQGTTLALNSVSVEDLGTSGSLSIDAGSGMLYMNGAAGSGSSQLTLGPTPAAQLNADLASLTYVPAAGATSDTVSITASPAAPVETTRSIPISITGGGPALAEPASETVAPGATVAIGGSYSDRFAQGNPGTLFLGISDSTGTLSATDAAGAAVAGSGSNNITVSADFVDVNAILASLHYTAGASAGSDAIAFDIWNQAGVQTTGTTSVTIDPPSVSDAISQASGSLLAEFTSPAAGLSGAAVAADPAVGARMGAWLTASGQHPIGVPLPLGH